MNAWKSKWSYKNYSEEKYPEEIYHHAAKTTSLMFIPVQPASYYCGSISPITHSSFPVEANPQLSAKPWFIPLWRCDSNSSCWEEMVCGLTPSPPKPAIYEGTGQFLLEIPQNLNVGLFSRIICSLTRYPLGYLLEICDLFPHINKYFLSTLTMLMIFTFFVSKCSHIAWQIASPSSLLVP